MNLLQAWISLFVARSFMYAQGLEPKNMPIKLFEFLPPALSHVVSSPVGYMAMRYIPYPLYILVSSCKLIPVMIVGMIINGNFPTKFDLGSASIMTIGIILYSYTQIFGGGSNSHHENKDTHHDLPSLFGFTLDETGSLIVGILFTLTNLTLEGYTNACQDRLFNKVTSSPPPPSSSTSENNDTVIMTNDNNNEVQKPSISLSSSTTVKPQRIPSLWMQTAMNTLTSSTLAICMTIEYLIISNKENTFLGYTFSFIHRHPELLWHILSFALLGSFAQLFIYTTIENYGSFTTTTITISRKFVSVLLSVIIFQHILQWNQWLGIICVFTGLGIQLTYGGKKRTHIHNQHHKPIDASVDGNNIGLNDNNNNGKINLDQYNTTMINNDTTTNNNNYINTTTLRKRREDFQSTSNSLYGATVPLSPAKDERPNVWEEPKKDV